MIRIDSRASIAFMTLSLPDNFKMTDEIQRAIDLLAFPGKHVFVSGKAGTGKSTFLTYIRKHFEKRNLAIVAPTGVAALNVAGQTIHSFFKIKPGLFDAEEVGPRRNRRLYEKLDLLVIDEISMVRSDLLDMIDLFLRNNGPKKGVPFGGVQLCLIGDIGQLPPVVGRDEREIFYQMYQDRDFFHANAFRNLDIETIQFKEIFRQTDRAFIDILNRVRNRENSEELLQTLNSRHKIPPEDKDYVTLTTRKVDANSINIQKLKEIETPSKKYTAKIIGDAKTFANKTPAPEELTLKTGAFVMILKNDPKRRWVNGTTGVITWMSDDVIFVKKTDGSEVRIEREKWEHVKYGLDKKTEKITQKILGSFEQFPINLSWAMTIHKAQGKTLEAVVIDSGNGFFEKGQLYVALSRCISFENLYLKKPMRYSDLTTKK